MNRRIALLIAAIPAAIAVYLMISAVAGGADRAISEAFQIEEIGK